MMRKHIVIFSLSDDGNDTLTLFGENMPIYRTLEIKNIIATKNCDICSPSLIPLLQDKLVGLKTYRMQVQCKYISNYRFKYQFDNSQNNSCKSKTMYVTKFHITVSISDSR